MKRIWVVALMVLSLLVGVIGHAEGITPFSRDIKSAKATLTIQGTVAECNSFIYANATNSRIEFTMYLRKESSGRWIDVKKWTISGIRTVNLKRTYTVSSPGKYRVVARGTVKDPAGKVLEKISVNSSIVTL
jgi:hypothetical protein